MNELRKIEKAINKYLNLLAVNQENAKKYCKDYLVDVEIIEQSLKDFIDQTSNIFQKWCDNSVSVFNSNENNIFLRIKKYIDMKIVNHYLNRFSYDLSKAGILQNNLKSIKERLNQYKYFS